MELPLNGSNMDLSEENRFPPSGKLEKCEVLEVQKEPGDNEEVPAPEIKMEKNEEDMGSESWAQSQETSGPCGSSVAQSSTESEAAQLDSAPVSSRVTDPSESVDSQNKESGEEPSEVNPSLQNLLSSSASPSEEALEAGPSGCPGTDPSADYYFVKWINWKGERTPIITQSENGPCPLLAIMNILFLRWKVKLPPQKEVVTSEELMAHLGDCILSIQPQENSEALQLNFQQNVNDAMTVLPKLSTGLDVNVRFTGVGDFEYTPECIVFDLLNIPLYHGWLVDPQSAESVQAVGKLSYNQLVEKIITCKHSNDSSLVAEGLIAELFLESSAAQLTYHGLCELMAAVKEGEVSVFFRNNHFSTLIKHKGHLYLLVTDQGFLNEEKVIWESLHNVEGDSCFCDSDFHLTQQLEKEFSSPQQLQHRQVDQDYMIALSLQQQQQGPLAMSDLELAQQLQQEEYQQQQQQPPPPQQATPQQARAQTSGRSSGERRQRQKPDSDCTLL
ncbi:ubiquitin carboxyl-terminal hydrolase MINDY-1 [Xenopus laevis]|uniref:Ubiquitin carboxyl-terminal hydrolase n=2 Tax=Xenopus laevis TaxID=8355 RepID=A0A974H6G7_XENLA|nr:ubiquitin carboxyl-terminal hydrolase MINDY-1 [Xenopus laevis]OCT66572.1 hypothetical protein XELAEV_18042824mg [Xenopus laevis]